VNLNKVKSEVCIKLVLLVTKLHYKNVFSLVVFAWVLTNQKLELNLRQIVQQMNILQGEFSVFLWMS
jgi:hypothetical protein